MPNPERVENWSKCCWVCRPIELQGWPLMEGCCALCRPIKVPRGRALFDSVRTTIEPQKSNGVFRLIVDENVVKVVGWFGQRRCGGAGAITPT